jgi:hypothetical protein
MATLPPNAQRTGRAAQRAGAPALPVEYSTVKLDTHLHRLAGFIAGKLLLDFYLVSGESLDEVANVIERAFVAALPSIDHVQFEKEIESLCGVIKSEDLNR